MLYELLKQVQLFTIASVDRGSSETIDLKPAKIETRRDLVTYLESYVPANFFFEADVLNTVDEITPAQRE